MNQNSLHAEIDRQAAKLGAYHGPLFVKKCRALLARPGLDLREENIEELATVWKKALADEHARIRAIDAALATMPPGYEALADAAKYESQITADEFVQRALRAHGNATQAMARWRRG